MLNGVLSAAGGWNLPRKDHDLETGLTRTSAALRQPLRAGHSGLRIGAGERVRAPEERRIDAEMSGFLEASPGIEPGCKDLQSSA